MDYTGKHYTMYSEICGEMVNVLKYKSNTNLPYCECDRCGKMIKRTIYVVQSAENDVEMMYLGSECIKHFC